MRLDQLKERQLDVPYMPDSAVRLYVKPGDPVLALTTLLEQNLSQELANDRLRSFDTYLQVGVSLSRMHKLASNMVKLRTFLRTGITKISADHTADSLADRDLLKIP
jgi:hypothetical protein